MGSLPSEGLDEAHCFWAMCPHPSCWEAEHRIAKGTPRHIKSRTPDRGRDLVDEEEFPTLSVVNVSEWTEGKTPPMVKLLYKTLSKENIATDAITLLSSQLQTHQREHCMRLDSADLHFPGFNSVVQSPRDKQNRGLKLSTAQINPLASCSSSASWGSGSLVMWIPNPQHIPQCHSQNRSGSPHVAVKEIICLPSLQLYKSSTMNRKKSKNVKKRVQFQLSPLTSHQRSEQGLGSPVAEQAVDTTDPALAQCDTDSNPRGEEETGSPPNLTLETGPEAHGSPRPPSAPRAPSAFLLRNKPVVFHSVRERVLRRHTQQNLPASKYKLDTKTGGDGIDWESLRRQTYLWRKHHLPAVNRDKEKPPTPEDMTASQPAQQWDGFGFYPIPKATLHHHPRSPLSIGPAVWHCVDCAEGMWCHHGGVLGTKSKCQHTGAANSYFKLCSDSNSSYQNPMRPLLDKDDLSEMESGQGAIAPYNSMLYLQDTAQQERYDCRGEDAMYLVYPERDSKRGAADRTGSSEDKDPGPSGFQPSPPPSSLNSDSGADGKP